MFEYLNETDWRDQVKLECKEVIRERGMDITMEDLVQEIAPKGSGLVPNDIKKSLMKDLQKFVDEQVDK